MSDCSSPSPAAERQRRHRQRSDQGRACSLVDYDSDVFHACELAGLIRAEEADDKAAVRRALSALLARAARVTLEEDFLSRVTSNQVRRAYASPDKG